MHDAPHGEWWTLPMAGTRVADAGVQAVPRRPPKPLSRQVAGAAVLIACAIVSLAWLGVAGAVEPVMPTAGLVAGAGAVVVALAAWMRADGVREVVETLGDVTVAFLALIGVVLSAVVGFFLHRLMSLLGWD